MSYQRERDDLLALYTDWQKCPSVYREGKWFYYRRVAGVAYRVVQDWVTDRWFLQISVN